MLRYYVLALLLLTVNTSSAMDQHSEDNEQSQLSEFDALLTAYCTASTEKENTSVYNALKNFLHDNKPALYASINNHAHSYFYTACLWNAQYYNSKQNSPDAIEDYLIIAALYIAETKASGCQAFGKIAVNQLILDPRMTEGSLCIEALRTAENRYPNTPR